MRRVSLLLLVVVVVLAWGTVYGQTKDSSSYVIEVRKLTGEDGRLLQGVSGWVFEVGCGPDTGRVVLRRVGSDYADFSGWSIRYMVPLPGLSIKQGSCW